MGLRNLSRDTSLKIHYFLDHWVPPAIRDCRWIMSIPMRILFRHRYSIYLDFKKNAFGLTDKEFSDVYRLVSDTAIQRETDLNEISIEKIQKHVTGPTVLDVGCGRGFLANLLSAQYRVTGVDIVIPDALRTRYPQVTFQEAGCESLPFADKQFDTVICTHTLEHVRNMHLAIKELRRVGKKLIIIVPKQRPYHYTFDLHLNFFPYIFYVEITA
ncbi:MAG: class I SAM-dependent methyltransferase [Rickettsiales bacterium]|nr:class I SAM-dependent methyltransferase [Rickettsiales bacterium]